MKIRAFPKGVGQYKDQHGKVRTRGRKRGWPTYYFKSEPGTNEFEEELRRWMGGTASCPPVGFSRTRPGSISDLITRYYSSAEFYGLAASTKVTYRGIIERFREKHGEKPVRLLQREHVRRIIAAQKDRPAAANNLLKILRILMHFAMDEGFRNDDPTYGVRNVKNHSGGFHTWTEGEINQYRARHAIGTPARLALDLLLYTGQRRSDVVRMSWRDVHGEYLHVRQQKTGTELEIPLHPGLIRSIRATAGEVGAFLVTSYGKPFTAAGFGNWFRRRVNEADLPDCCAAHGLRKAAARKLAEAGCSIPQIAAITGHRSLKELTRYIADASQMHMAKDAMTAQVRAEREQNLANPSHKLASEG